MEGLLECCTNGFTFTHLGGALLTERIQCYMCTFNEQLASSMQKWQTEWKQKHLPKGDGQKNQSNLSKCDQIIKLDSIIKNC
jgi:hypothetical protein